MTEYLDVNLVRPHSQVSQACKRLDEKLAVDRRLRIQVSNIIKRIRKTAEVETPVVFAFFGEKAISFPTPHGE